MDWKLVAPISTDFFLSFSRGYKNPSAQTRKVLEALDRLLGELADLKPLTGNGEVKSIWLKIPRGTLDDFGDYDELLAEGEVSSHEDYVGLWKSEYPDDYSWYELVVVENEHCRAVSVGSVMVLCADSNQKPADFDWLEEHAVILLDLLVHFVRKSMRELREGSYNATVAEQLPYFYVPAWFREQSSGPRIRRTETPSSTEWTGARMLRSANMPQRMRRTQTRSAAWLQ